MSLKQSDLSFLTYWMFSKLGTYQGRSTYKVFVYSRSRLYACFQFPIYIILLLENNQGYNLQCIYISSCTWSVFPINIHWIQALNTNILKIVGSVFMLSQVDFYVHPIFVSKHIFPHFHRTLALKIFHFKRRRFPVV